MLVHLVEAIEHLPEIVAANGNHGRKPDRRIHRVASADPIPESEHVRRIDPELRHFLRICRNGNEMSGHTLWVASKRTRATIREPYEHSSSSPKW